MGLGCLPEQENASTYNKLVVEQVKVVDMEGNMKLLYPSRVDLNFAENFITVLREI